jgi:hypothetical protein
MVTFSPAHVFVSLNLPVDALPGYSEYSSPIRKQIANKIERTSELIIRLLRPFLPLTAYPKSNFAAEPYRRLPAFYICLPRIVSDQGMHDGARYCCSD